MGTQSNIGNYIMCSSESGSFYVLATVIRCREPIFHILSIHYCPRMVWIANIGAYGFTQYGKIARTGRIFVLHGIMPGDIVLY